MASVFSYIGIVETILADVDSFASGTPVSQTVDGYTITIQKFGGTEPTGFTVISGSVLAIILSAFTLYASFEAGVSVQVAVKEGNTWYGVTLVKATSPA